MSFQDNNNVADEILVKDDTGQFTVFGGAAPAASASAAPQDSSWAAVEGLISQLNFNFYDEVLDRRLKNILLAAVKGIRNSVQTKEALIKSVDVGGAGLAENQADLIVARLSQSEVLPNFLPAAKAATFVPPLGPEVLPTPVIAEPISRSAETAKEFPPKKFTVQELEHELAPPPPATSAAVELRSAAGSQTFKVKPRIALAAKKPEPSPEHYLSRKIKPFVLENKAKRGWDGLRALVTAAKPAVKEPFPPKPASPDAGQVGNPPSPLPKIVVPTRGEKITDIKVPSRLVGPIEELRNFRLVDFRALTTDPQKTILKIKEKIDLLLEQSFTKRMAGVEAWKQSEVYRLYLVLGRASLEGRKPLAEVIIQRAANNQLTLNENEFRALGRLSNMLEV